MRPPMKSIYADRERDETLPWEDVIIDVQGPFTMSDDGNQYLLSYHCSQLRAPLLEPFKSSQEAILAERSLRSSSGPRSCHRRFDLTEVLK